jgi:uncharacterized repeat protein (TIGR02543 family)
MKRIFTGLVLGAVLILSPAAKGGNPELPLNLQSADDFVILAKSGISTVPPSAITGDMGVSPITSTAITGFALIMDSSGEFSTSAQVTGKIYAPDYASPTPVKMTAAISDMETAYTNAAGRTIPDTNNLGATAGSDKDIGGLTFVPGLHKWSTGVLLSANLTIDALGDPNAVFIFQIEGDLTVASGKRVILAGGAQAKNIFWQVAGGAGAIIGTTAHFEGVLLTATGINVLTGASFNGKLLAQTDVNLQSNRIVDSSLINQHILTYTAGLGGSVLGDSPQTVAQGNDGTMVTAVADPGFVFIGWTGTDPSPDNPRTDLNVMSDITVEAQFQPLAPNQYVFTYRAGLGGSVNGVTIQVVDQGNDGSMVTAVPNPGFIFVGWTGTDSSLDNPRTDLNAIADITVRAQFSPTGPEIVVEEPVGVNVPDGGGRDFGPVLVGGTKDLVFTVSNSGDTNLDLTLPITFSGPNAAMFTVTAAPMTTLPPGASTTFTVRFAPLTDGTKVAVLHLSNNDSNENPFDIILSGLGSGVSVVSASPITLNPQTGLLEQTVRVSNTDLLTVGAVRLLVNGLPADVQVYNASGSIGGIPYLQHDFPLAQGEEIVFVIEYYRLSRHTDFTPVFASEATPPVSPPAPAGEIISIDRQPAVLGGRVLIDFTTTPGRRYVVQYSSNLTDWKTTDPIITAPSNRVQWYDDGPPKTESKPDSVGSRFYRIVQLP